MYSHISLKGVNKNDPIPTIGLPGSMIEDTVTNEDELTEPELDYVSPAQLQDNLITMSGLAHSRWQNLLNIDIIRKKNKPKKAPEVPESAPFFLPTIPSLELKFDLSSVKDAEVNKKLIIHPELQNLTLFAKSLLSMEDPQLEEVIEKFKNMSPSSIDFEIQSFSADEKTSNTLLLHFMKIIYHMMEKRMNFELAQAYLAVFLKYHGTTIAKDETLRNYLDTLHDIQLKSWFILKTKFFYNLSVVQALKKM